MENVELLKKFIVDNNLQFTEGVRNNNCVILCGFALFKGFTMEDCFNSINKDLITLDLDEELQRVFEFAQKNNYNLWWEKEEAKKMYKF